METWFLADPDMLKDYFDAGFRQQHIPSRSRLEDVAKKDVLKALELATKNCKTRYAKGRVSITLLAKLNPRLVEQACPHARKLLAYLRTS